MPWTQLACVAVAAVYLWLLSWCRCLSRRLCRMERQSRLDPLTGLGSGHWLNTERWPAALRSSRPLTVVHLDLDHLKLHNERLGISFGDQLIKTAADALRDRLRHGCDEVFRLHTAGDEFVLLLSGPIADPRAFAWSLLVRLRRRGVMASIGVGVTAETQFLPVRADLRIVAERACKRAKQSGGDCAIVFIEVSQERTDGAPVQRIAHDPPEPLHGQRLAAAVHRTGLSAAELSCGAADCIPQPIEDDANTQATDPTAKAELLAQMSIPRGAADDAVAARIALANKCPA